MTCWLSAGRWVDFGSPFRAYLSQRIRWAILDEVRSQRWTTGPRDASAVYARPEPISPTTHPCGVDGGYETAEVLADVGRAIEDLPETTRHAAALLASGLSPTQVAERLGVTQSRVSQHRRRLRAALERIARSIP